jgi:hypothetical protein
MHAPAALLAPQLSVLAMMILLTVPASQGKLFILANGNYWELSVLDTTHAQYLDFALGTSFLLLAPLLQQALMWACTKKGLGCAYSMVEILMNGCRP